MRLDHPDPDYSSSPRARANFVLAVKLSLGLLALIWLVFLVDQLSGLRLIRFGLVPREAVGLLGLLTTPLLHYNLAHITSNTLPLLVGGTLVLYLYPHAAVRALPAIWLGAGLLAWLIARPSVHIGASGLVYGLLAFILVSGLVRRELRAVGAAGVVWFLYGSLLYGILPSGPGTSWELHAAGFLIGALAAWRLRGLDRPPLKRYEWEDEELDPNEPSAPWREQPERWH
ncbi:MAG: rhomboid family intramembrane serine protease [Wenzhouxiangellaceae bacterium]|nr:rhomboid family intramembrane serine protease [Wenzhouxiangellaceae bacterium]